MKKEKMRLAVEQVAKNYFVLYPDNYYPPYVARHNLLPSKNGQKRVLFDAAWEFTARVFRFNEDTGKVDTFEESGVVLSSAASDHDCQDEAIVRIKKYYNKNNRGAVTITSCWLVRDRLITAPKTNLKDIFWWFWRFEEAPLIILNTEKIA